MTNIPRLVDPTMVIGYSCISTTDRHVAPNGCTYHGRLDGRPVFSGDFDALRACDDIIEMREVLVVVRNKSVGSLTDTGDEIVHLDDFDSREFLAFETTGAPEVTDADRGFPGIVLAERDLALALIRRNDTAVTYWTEELIERLARVDDGFRRRFAGWIGVSAPGARDEAWCFFYDGHSYLIPDDQIARIARAASGAGATLPDLLAPYRLRRWLVVSQTGVSLVDAFNEHSAKLLGGGDQAFIVDDVGVGFTVRYKGADGAEVVR